MQKRCIPLELHLRSAVSASQEGNRPEHPIVFAVTVERSPISARREADSSVITPPRLWDMVQEWDSLVFTVLSAVQRAEASGTRVGTRDLRSLSIWNDEVDCLYSIGELFDS